MDLCLDVGNSYIYGGLCEGEKIHLRFRHASHKEMSSDQFGLFLRSVLRENDFEIDLVKRISICSVVPAIDYTIRSACIKYFKMNPFFLTHESETGLDNAYQQPAAVGADRIANAVAAVHSHPNMNLIVIDFGTATTLCAITKNKKYLGGAIMPGMKLSRDTLKDNAAKLFPVEILKPRQAVGQSTIESLQSGLFYMQVGALKELTSQFAEEVFQDQPPMIIATGGFSHLFKESSLFSIHDPDLVLRGLQILARMNEKAHV